MQKQQLHFHSDIILRFNMSFDMLALPTDIYYFVIIITDSGSISFLAIVHISAFATLNDVSLVYALNNKILQLDAGKHNFSLILRKK